ncbi:hypothetical protein ACHAW5_001316 [Stephanodiscus triporus]|uniref:SET domain-containing protein n=1 Tax=Stephanodiscus triporus TaxID=2934178 RepID=A0ABD3MIU0_9STRA
MKSRWKLNIDIAKECVLNKDAWIECDENCDGREECENRNIQKSGYKKVTVKTTNGKGNGLFADEDIKAGEYIIERKYSMKYTGMNLWIDAIQDGNRSRFINHLCNLNCVVQQWCINGMPHMCFFALKDISSGTELTFKYNWTLDAKDDADFKSKATVCNCGSKKEKHYMENMALIRRKK